MCPLSSTSAPQRRERRDRESCCAGPARGLGRLQTCPKRTSIADPPQIWSELLRRALGRPGAGAPNTRWRSAAPLARSSSSVGMAFTLTTGRRFVWRSCQRSSHAFAPQMSDDRRAVLGPLARRYRPMMGRPHSGQPTSDTSRNSPCTSTEPSAWARTLGRRREVEDVAHRCSAAHARSNWASQASASQPTQSRPGCRHRSAWALARHRAGPSTRIRGRASGPVGRRRSGAEPARRTARAIA